ncbi:hypothetical protein N665_0052s0017 [Sinapis alba]|nr:hypothetical protein N665_0052s0017 [Sinapis alba]
MSRSYGNKDGGKHKGSVKWFDTQKGFGFITPNESGDALFVHHCAPEETVKIKVKVDSNNVIEGSYIVSEIVGNAGAVCGGGGKGGERDGGRRGYNSVGVYSGGRDGTCYK